MQIIIIIIIISTYIKIVSFIIVICNRSSTEIPDRLFSLWFIHWLTNLVTCMSY